MEPGRHMLIISYFLICYGWFNSVVLLKKGVNILYVDLNWGVYLSISVKTGGKIPAILPT